VGLPPEAVATARIARTYQNIRLFKSMTALENVMVGRHVLMRAGVFGAVFTPPPTRQEEATAETRAFELLDFVGLRGREAEVSINLSYGDQRRLEIARALALEPELLLLDEPTAGMSPAETSAVADLVLHLRDERGLTVLLVEHDMSVVMGISDKITVMDYGEEIARGTPDEVRNDPRVLEAYLGGAA
jgi:branched-chain amino acid transport system ATP-binding protein